MTDQAAAEMSCNNNHSPNAERKAASAILRGDSRPATIRLLQTNQRPQRVRPLTEPRAALLLN